LALTPREKIGTAAMIATHEIISNLSRAKSAMEDLIHEVSDLTALVAADGRVVWGNVATAVWLGVEQDVVHERNLKEIFIDPGVFLGRLDSLSLDTEAKDEFSLSLIHNGQLRDLLWTIKPFQALSNRRGRLYLVTGRDITDFSKAQRAQAKLEAELETAQILQRRFLPETFLQTPDLRIAAFYQPAEQCSGDWWGRFELGGGHELICIADVTGHGAASALVTSMTQALSLSFVHRHQNKAISPAALIKEINEVVFKTFHGDMYMTFFAIVMVPDQGKIVASNAAHNFPMILRPCREAKNKLESLVVQGNPIGHALLTPFIDVTYKIQAGDRIVLYTDGLTECRNRENRMYGAGAFRRSILRHTHRDTEDFRDHLVGEALTFYGGQPLADDITLVVIDMKSE
jgi:serine phosphatase RsbU (regulator of sigma subunit)